MKLHSNFCNLHIMKPSLFWPQCLTYFARRQQGILAVFYNSLISALDTGNSVFLGELFGRYWGWYLYEIRLPFDFCLFFVFAVDIETLDKRRRSVRVIWAQRRRRWELCLIGRHTWWHTGTLQWALDKCENTTAGGHRRIHQNYSAQNRYFDDRRVQEFWQEPKTGPKQKPSAGEPRPASPDIKKAKMKYSFL